MPSLVSRVLRPPCPYIARRPLPGTPLLPVYDCMACAAYTATAPLPPLVSCNFHLSAPFATALSFCFALPYTRPRPAFQEHSDLLYRSAHFVFPIDPGTPRWRPPVPAPLSQSTEPHRFNLPPARVAFVGAVRAAVNICQRNEMWHAACPTMHPCCRGVTPCCHQYWSRRAAA